VHNIFRYRTLLSERRETELTASYRHVSNF